MKAERAGWVVIQMAYSASRARAIEDLLKREGFMVKIHPVSGEVNQEGQLFEIMALTSEAREARNLLLESGM